MGVHPQSAQCLLASALQANELPALLESWGADELTERHVKAALDELHGCLDDEVVRASVLESVLTRCRDQARLGRNWPTPGELRRLIRVAALLHDLEAAARRRVAKRNQRGVHASPLPDGQAALIVEGPAEQILEMAQAIRGRAEHLRGKADDSRTLAQREFDVTYELLISGEGGSGRAVVQIQVLVPFATATGAAHELGELIGMGPVLPGTCRELMERASSLQRVCTDSRTGKVLAVDAIVPATAEALAGMRTAPLVVRDLSTTAYRPTPRALRLVATRDQTCRFPGCTILASRSDVDHRRPWPHGPTEPANLQCLCRHHHRAKQSGLFAVSSDADGSTTWTVLATGKSYRKPPPALRP